MLLIAGLEPANRTIWDQYNPIVRRHLLETWDAPPPSVILHRTGALAPSHPLVIELLEGLRERGRTAADAADVRAFVETIRGRYRD
jgi:hypothetical protein